MEKIEYLCKSLADFLWGDWLLAALLGLGALYTVITGGVQFRCVHLLRKGFFSLGKKQDQVRDEKKCSSYQALCAAVASCVGSGNIVGVSTAILSGGPGALFWMWAAAFKSVFPGMQYVIYISLILFASTSLMSQWYFGHVSLTYLKKPGLAAVYRYLFPVLIILGSLGSIDMVWYIQDCALGLLILPNIAALIGLAPQVRKLVKEFMDPKNGYLT